MGLRFAARFGLCCLKACSNSQTLKLPNCHGAPLRSAVWACAVRNEIPCPARKRINDSTHQRKPRQGFAWKQPGCLPTGVGCRRSAVVRHSETWQMGFIRRPSAVIRRPSPYSATWALNQAMKSSVVMKPRSPSPRLRTETPPASDSFSPTMSMMGTFFSSVSRILRPMLSLRSST
jgi:hypothetical protein